MQTTRTRLTSWCLTACALLTADLAAQTDATQVAQEQPVDVKAFDDGPYVFWETPTNALLLGHLDGEVVSTRVTDITEPVEMRTPYPGVPTVHLNPGGYTPSASTWPMPDRLLVVSDLEGNHDTFLEFLRTNGVIDEEGNWAWGKGHLVFDGDIVDRGDKVTEILWLIQRLEREAKAAGGRVHYVLGNHETMVLAGDLRYIHPKYRVTSERMGRSYEALFGPDTELGRWLRSHNSVVRIGDFLFVHAGYSPELDTLGLDRDEINQRIRDTIGPPAWPERDQLGPHLIWHQQGPMWYRGHFDAYAAQWGGKPTDEQLDAILERNGAKHIVIGHTVVEDIGWLDAKKRVLGIDVKWSKPGEGEGLLVENGVIHAVDMTGKKRTIEVVQP
jgi:hypothetical protein